MSTVAVVIIIATLIIYITITVIIVIITILLYVCLIVTTLAQHISIHALCILANIPFVSFHFPRTVLAYYL